MRRVYLTGEIGSGRTYAVAGALYNARREGRRTLYVGRTMGHAHDVRTLCKASHLDKEHLFVGPGYNLCGSRFDLIAVDMAVLGLLHWVHRNVANQLSADGSLWVFRDGGGVRGQAADAEVLRTPRGEPQYRRLHADPWRTWTRLHFPRFDNVAAMRTASLGLQGLLAGDDEGKAIAQGAASILQRRKLGPLTHAQAGWCLRTLATCR